MAKTQYYGTGRRKSSVARVRLVPGNGNITVNKKSLDDYLSQEIVKREVKRPFEIAGCEGKFDVIATVHGGGYTGQAGALRHGISRALCEADREAYRPALKAAGFLTRDSRMKERNTVSRKQEEQASSRRDSSTCPCDCSEWSRAMECAPSYVARALLRGDQRRRSILASILLNTICVDDPRIPTLGIGGFCMQK